LFPSPWVAPELEISWQEDAMTDTNEAARGGRGAARDATVGELARQLPEQISRLVREELRLAQLEMAQKGKRAARGADQQRVPLAMAAGGVALLGAVWIVWVTRRR
jgi:hypothetical protein